MSMIKTTRIFWTTKEVRTLTKHVLDQSTTDFKNSMVVSNSLKKKTGRWGSVHGLNEMIMAAQLDLLPSSRLKNKINPDDINKIKTVFAKMCGKNSIPSTQAQLRFVKASEQLPKNESKQCSLELMERKVAIMKDIKSLGLSKDQENSALAAIL